MKKIKSTLLKLWKDESGQGTAEYVLILVAIVGLGFLFKDRIRKILGDKLTSLAGDISSFTKD
ncbi:MAG: Flp1 family type IVb pilin [Bdellovibrionales bacterium]|nr:Flp1 family type IVb pilin [Bdellovibrionales bacterium]